MIKIEKWKDINGYEGIYQISNYGNVKSLSRKMWNGYKYWDSKEKILKPRMAKDKSHYETVCLRKDGKSKTFSIHRLVAIHFIPMVNGKNYVNHKDENKRNNHFSNLEWTTAKENINYKDNQLRKGNNRSTKVKGVNISTNEIIIISNKNEAEELGFNKKTISKVADKENRTYKGYRWYNLTK